MLGQIPKFLFIIVKNIRRNLVRSTLTGLGTMVLVLVVTAVWSVLSFIEAQTTEKANDFKVLVTEKNKAPSRLPYSYVNSLKEGAARNQRKPLRRAAPGQGSARRSQRCGIGHAAEAADFLQVQG